jgi:hypothetical protein
VLPLLTTIACEDDRVEVGRGNSETTPRSALAAEIGVRETVAEFARTDCKFALCGASLNDVEIDA